MAAAAAPYLVTSAAEEPAAAPLLARDSYRYAKRMRAAAQNAERERPLVLTNVR